MAIETPLELFQGTDKQYVFTIKNAAQTACVDITGWALSWMVKRYPSDADGAALITKTISAGIAISGSFNSDPALNTQVATVTLADTDSTSIAEGYYHHELKRTDDTFEAVLSFGGFSIRQGVHR